MGASPRYKSLRGMPDVLPAVAGRMRRIEREADEVFRMFGFGEIRTPVLEETEVFTRSIGEDTDIVEKEMYSFTDRGGKNVSLRPEGTASIVRAYIEHGWNNTEGLAKLYYKGPMFRGERPQKGRLRQFYQIGAEVIGASDPYIDAELILSLHVFLSRLGVKDFTVLINSLGCGRDLMSYKRALGEYLSPRAGKLCENCRRRSKTNVLRVLDCKSAHCRDVVAGAPVITDYLCDGCRADYAALKDILLSAGVVFKEKKDLVRGLDYYTGSIFEVVHPALGAQDAMAAGGRYDGLTQQMGGPDVGATGYAVGVERLLLTINDKECDSGFSGVLVVPIGTDFREHAFSVCNVLRANEVPCEMDYSGRSVKGQLRRAHREGRRFVIIIGENEIKSGELLLKDMEDGSQEKMIAEKAAWKLRKELNG